MTRKNDMLGQSVTPGVGFFQICPFLYMAGYYQSTNPVAETP
jgi:hypothetical protein